MNAYPVFVDNRDGNTLADALGEALRAAAEGLGESTAAPDQVRIAQPKVRPLNLRVAEFIRAHPAVDVPEDEVNRALDVLESPWPRREEIMLRHWFEDENLPGVKLSKFLIEQIAGTGLEPVEPPEPLPPISAHDIQLLCWLGIDTE